MQRSDLNIRTKNFSLTVIKLVSALPKRAEAVILGKQLLRSATSVGANYREASRAQTPAEFRHKVNIIEKEAAETQYWLELLKESRLGQEQELEHLYQEASELLAIFTAISKKARTNLREIPGEYDSDIVQA